MMFRFRKNSNEPVICAIRVEGDGIKIGFENEQGDFLTIDDVKTVFPKKYDIGKGDLPSLSQRKSLRGLDKFYDFFQILYVDKAQTESNYLPDEEGWYWVTYYYPSISGFGYIGPFQDEHQTATHAAEHALPLNDERREKSALGFIGNPSLIKHSTPHLTLEDIGGGVFKYSFGKRPEVTEDYFGSNILLNAIGELKIDLPRLIAMTSIWAPKAAFDEKMVENGLGVYFSDTKRASKKKGETPKTRVNGIYLDDNTKANHSIKYVQKDWLGVSKTKAPELLKGYHTCHIWDETCYDVRYHTCLANLVLVPSELSALTDHNAEIQSVLKYRAFEVFGWFPEGEEEPKKPSCYPSEDDWNFALKT
jgi:hypothetical protein